METRPPSPIDIVIKYGAAIAALAYLLGFIEVDTFLRRFPLGSLGVPSAQYFAAGGNLLWLAAGPPIIIATAAGCLFPPRIVGQYKRHGAALAFMCTSIGLFVLMFWGYHSWVRESILSTLAGIAAGVLTLYLMSTEDVQPFTFWREAGLLGIVLFSLLGFALGVGRVRYRALLSEKTNREVRLLISGDAVRGAQEVGFTFPNWKPGEASAELSDKVEVVYDAGSDYILRVNGQITHLSKSKVLASVP